MSKQQITTSVVFDALRRTESRIVSLRGSSRSTKTYSVIQWMIALALENEELKKPKSLSFLILRSRLTWVRHTVLKDFIDIMREQFGLYKESDYNKKDATYTLGHSSFVFGGDDDPYKWSGFAGDYVFLNECDQIKYATVNQLLIRLKGRMIVDYNPCIPESHYILTKLESREDCTVLHSTYKDNPFLPQQIVDEIESREPTQQNIENGTADETIWKIYGLGIRAQIKGVVFPNFNIVSEFPDIKEFGYGGDWGFMADPTTLIQCCEYHGELYFREKLYERGLLDIINPHNPSALSVELRFKELEISKTHRIWADSADPKAIKNLQYVGYNIDKVSKTPGSILAGLNLLKRYKLNITEDSLNTIQEFQNYKWKETKSGESLNMPVDTWNHAIDGIRYWGWMELADNMSRRSGYRPQIGSLKMSTSADRYAY